MEALSLIIIGLIAFPILLIIRSTTAHKSNLKTGMLPRKRLYRCPNCGSPVINYSSYWECGFCGDSGRYLG